MRHPRLGALPAIALLLVATLAATAEISPQAIACSVTYGASNWGGGGGFTANLRITNLGDPVTGWTLTFAFPGDQRVTQGWSATWNQEPGSSSVSATSLSWNGNLAANQSTDIGFNGTFTGTNTAPAGFALNGVACAGANQAPTVTLTQPATGSTFTAGSNIPLAATAADPDGTVQRVEFYAGATLIGTDTAGPYGLTWTNVAAGNYVLVARAVDNAGGTTNSAPVDVTVTPDTGPSVVAASTAVAVPEGGTATVTLRLSQQPSGTVTVTLARSTGDTDLTVVAPTRTAGTRPTRAPTPACTSRSTPGVRTWASPPHWPGR